MDPWTYLAPSPILGSTKNSVAVTFTPGSLFVLSNEHQSNPEGYRFFQWENGAWTELAPLYGLHEATSTTEGGYDWNGQLEFVAHSAFLVDEDAPKIAFVGLEVFRETGVRADPPDTKYSGWVKPCVAVYDTDLATWTVYRYSEQVTRQTSKEYPDLFGHSVSCCGAVSGEGSNRSGKIWIATSGGGVSSECTGLFYFDENTLTIVRVADLPALTYGTYENATQYPYGCTPNGEVAWMSMFGTDDLYFGSCNRYYEGASQPVAGQVYKYSIQGAYWVVHSMDNPVIHSGGLPSGDDRFAMANGYHSGDLYMEQASPDWLKSWVRIADIRLYGGQKPVDIQWRKASLDTTVEEDDPTSPVGFTYTSVYSGAHILLINRVGVWEFNPGGSTGDVVSPECSISSPVGGTVAGLLSVSGQATDNLALSSVRVYVDAQYVSSAPVSGTEDDWTIQVNTRLFADGVHSIMACAVDEAGNVGWSSPVSVTVDNAGGVVDTQAPTVTILSPAPSAVVANEVPVLAQLVDNVALDKARVYVDGVLAGAERQLSQGEVEGASWTVDVGDLSNGDHTITVVAVDTSGLQGSASVVVSVNNLMADTAKELYTKELPVSATWKLGATGYSPVLHMLNVQVGEVPENPRMQYNVYVGYKASNTPGIPADFSLFSIMDDRSSFVVPMDATCIRWGLRAVPKFRTGDWTKTGYTSFFRILSRNDDTHYLVSVSPVAVWLFSGASVSLVANLTDSFGVTTVYEAVYNGKAVYLATDAGMFRYDVDSGEQSQMVLLDHSSPSTAQVAGGEETEDTVTMYSVVNGLLYCYTFESVTIKSSAKNGVLWYSPSVSPDIYMGNNAGVNSGVYKWQPQDIYGNNWLSVGATDNDVKRILVVPNGDDFDVWAGTTEGVYSSLGGWHKDATFGSGDVLALCEWMGYMWCAGTIDGLWRRGPSGWQKYMGLDDVVAVYDMHVVDGYLFLACEYNDGGTHKARLVGMYVDEGGSFVCGPVPPDVFARVLNYLKITEA